jgi:hypothetical protein
MYNKKHCLLLLNLLLNFGGYRSCGEMGVSILWFVIGMDRPCNWLVPHSWGAEEKKGNGFVHLSE